MSAGAVQALPPPLQYVLDHPERALGPWLCGGFAHFFLMGVLTMMTIKFYNLYYADKLSLRLLVGAIFIMNVLKTIRTAAVLWHKLIVEYGGPEPIMFSAWYAISQIMTGEIIAFTTQMYFIHR